MIATIKKRSPVNSAAFIGEAARARVAAIKQTIGDAYGFPVSDLESRHKQQKLAEARHVAMWACRRLVKTPQPFLRGLYPISHPDIASLFGFENHNTSMFAVKKVERMRAADPKFLESTNNLLVQLNLKLKEVA